MTKICIPESQPASEQEQAWITELKALHGDRLTANSVTDLDLLRFTRAYVNEENPKAKTFDTVQSYLDWRETEKIDELASTRFERYAEFVTMWPSGFSGLAGDLKQVAATTQGETVTTTTSTTPSTTLPPQYCCSTTRGTSSHLTPLLCRVSLLQKRRERDPYPLLVELCFVPKEKSKTNHMNQQAHKSSNKEAAEGKHVGVL